MKLDDIVLTMPNDPEKQGKEPAEESFADILNEFERTSAARPGASKAKGKRRSRSAGLPRRRGTVVGVSDDFVLIDYGEKSEGMIPSADLRDANGNLTVKSGETLDVVITGYNNEGMARLSPAAGPRPRDWETLTRAFDGKEV